MNLTPIINFLDPAHEDYETSQAQIKGLEKELLSLKSSLDKGKMFQPFKSGLGCSSEVKQKLALLDSNVSKCQDSCICPTIVFVTQYFRACVLRAYQTPPKRFIRITLH